MFDHRVARGTTCASVPAPVSTKHTLLFKTGMKSVAAAFSRLSYPTQIDGEQSIAARQAEARRRHLARKRAQAQATKALVMRIGSPPPVPGRKHEPVQTDVFLEEVNEN